MAGLKDPMERRNGDRREKGYADEARVRQKCRQKDEGAIDASRVRCGAVGDTVADWATTVVGKVMVAKQARGQFSPLPRDRELTVHLSNDNSKRDSVSGTTLCGIEWAYLQCMES